MCEPTRVPRKVRELETLPYDSISGPNYTAWFDLKPAYAHTCLGRKRRQWTIFIMDFRGPRVL